MDNNKVIFGAEFEGGSFSKGVNEAVQKLQEVKAAEAELRSEINQFTKALKDNENQLALNRAALDKAVDPKAKKDIQDTIDKLSAQNSILKTNLKEVQTQLIVAQKGVSLYNREVTNIVNSHNAVNLQLEKFTNVNHLAGEALGLFRRRVVDAGYALIAGFAGGLVSEVIPALTEFVVGLFHSQEGLTQTQAKADALNEALTGGGNGYSKAVSQVQELTTNIQLAKEGFIDKTKVVKEYNDTIGKTTGQVHSLDEAEQNLVKNGPAYIQFMLLKAAAQIALQKAGEKTFETEEQLRKSGANLGNPEVTGPVGGIVNQMKAELKSVQDQIKTANEEGNKALVKTLQDQADSLSTQIQNLSQKTLEGAFANKASKQRDAFIAVFQDIQREAAELAKTFHFDFFQGFNSDHNIENVFQQKLKELQAKLAEVTKQSFQSEKTIKDAFKAELIKQEQAITDLEKQGKLAGPSDVPNVTQGDRLRQLLGLITDAQMKTALDEFKRKRLEAEKQINDAIADYELQLSSKRIANIRDEFEREKQQITFQYSETLDALAKKRDELVAKIDKSDLSQADKKKQRIILFGIFADLMDEAETAKNVALINNSFKQYEAALKEGNKIFDALTLDVDEKTAQSIIEIRKQYDTGVIDYKTFQEKITSILKTQKEKRDQYRIDELQSDINFINKLIEQTQKTISQTVDESVRNQLQQQVQALQEQVISLRSQLAQAQANQAKDVPDPNADPNKGRGKQLQQYIEQLQSLLGVVVDFWQQVNATEEAALNRSIALQQTRVDNARIIAEKGNAEYLEMEQKRLDTLQRKQEENARKQLIINQALTVSNAILAAVKATAEANDPITAIAAGIAIFGAIASIFAFANSLQTPVATFYQGVESVPLGNNPKGRDTIPARLHEGERVVTARENKEYWHTLTAIHNRTIPADVLNTFVNSYPSVKVPGIDYTRLAGATSQPAVNIYNKTNFEELQQEIAGVRQAVEDLTISVKMDEEGFSAAITKSAKKKRLRMKS